MNKTWILWAVCIAIYILNIGIVAINGGTLINNIVAWVCCIVLTITIICIVKSSNLYKEILDAHWDNLPKMRILQTIITLQDIREKLQGNEEAIKVIDEEIERLEKEL